MATTAPAAPERKSKRKSSEPDPVLVAFEKFANEHGAEKYAKPSEVGSTRTNGFASRCALLTKRGHLERRPIPGTDGEFRAPAYEYRFKPTQASAERRALAAARRALEPFAHFAAQWNRKPVGRGGPRHVLYAIHAGTEYEAEITRAHLSAAQDALQQIGALRGERQS